MGGAVAQFAASGTAIVLAGWFLTRCGDAIAERTGFGRLLVGSLLIAAATSLPEILVDVNAVVREGAPDLAVGDLLGSSLMNLLILAGFDLGRRSRGRMLSRASAAHALSATTAALLTACVALAILVPFRVELFGVGSGVLAVVVAYLLGIRLVFFDQRFAAAERGEATPIPGTSRLSLRAAMVGFLASAAAIFAAAPLLASSATRIAETSGLGTTFVGTTLVALATSLPEMVSTAAAVRLGAFDLAVGNVFGSNAFNMVILLPVDLAHPGTLLADVSQAHAITAVAVVVVTCVTLLGLLYRPRRRLGPFEPGALLVLLLVAGTLVLLHALRGHAALR